MKPWERMKEHRHRKITRMAVNHCGFVLGRSTIEVVFLRRRSLKIYRERKRETYTIFFSLQSTEGV